MSSSKNSIDFGPVQTENCTGEDILASQPSGIQPSSSVKRKEGEVSFGRSRGWRIRWRWLGGGFPIVGRSSGMGLPAASGIVDHRIEVHEPALEQGLGHPLQRLVHPPIQDLSLKDPNNGQSPSARGGEESRFSNSLNILRLGYLLSYVLPEIQCKR